MNHLRIGQRLSLGFGIILLLAAMIAGVGWWRLHSSAAETERMMSAPLAKERLISDWLTVSSAGTQRAIAIARSADPGLGAFFANDIAAGAKAAAEFKKRVQPLVDRPEERALFEQIEQHRKAFAAGRDRIVALKKDSRSDEATSALESEFLPAAKAYAASMQQLLQLQRQQLDAMAQSLRADNATSGQLLWLLSALVIAAGSAFAWWITMSIARPLRTALEAAQRVADGDLAHTVQAPSGRDEAAALLRTLAHMQQRLVELVGQVRGRADNVATASTEIAQGNMDLSQRTERQAASLQETAATMEELSTTVDHNADRSGEADRLAADASKVALRGGEVVGQVVATMQAIQTRSRRIGDIISVIDGLAFQTNILALNAAVEAARAGEQGRGFAVVASEVRALAQRSAQAAKEIGELIGGSLTEVEQGSELVERAGQTMADIVRSIQEVSGIVAGISTASREQSEGVGRIGEAIHHMDQATQQNAALVEQSAAAAESLKLQSQRLVEAVSVFHL